jgi:hypothetical protein
VCNTDSYYSFQAWKKALQLADNPSSPVTPKDIRNVAQTYFADQVQFAAFCNALNSVIVGFEDPSQVPSNSPPPSSSPPAPPPPVNVVDSGLVLIPMYCLDDGAFSSSSPHHPMDSDA